MGIEREDIVQVLAANEVPLMERAERAGIKANSFYNKLRQFKATYPENWQEKVNEWLKTAGDEKAREGRVAALREQVRTRRLELVSIDHENEEDALLQELAELDERIAEKKAGKKDGKKAQKDPDKNKGKAPGQKAAGEKDLEEGKE